MSKTERESDQSITLFPLERSGTFPALSKDTAGMSLGGENAHMTSDKADTKLATPVVSEFGRPMVTSQHPGQRQHARLRQLSPTEWERVARGVGAFVDDGEKQTIVHPTCWYWPPKGLPQGLYRDSIMQKTKNFYQYHVLATIRWILMISQIILGAILTALGSVSSSTGTPITLLAALNTVDAGLLALMHNTGIPERYRSNRVEFSKVEDAIVEILDSGVVEWNQTVDEVLFDCFDKFQCAKASVNANMPSSYVSQGSQRQKSDGAAGPPVHNPPSAPHPGP